MSASFFPRYSMRYAPNLCKMQLHKNTWKNNELNSSPVSCVYYLSENVIVSLVSVEITRREYISTRKMEWKKEEDQKCRIDVASRCPYKPYSSLRYSKLKHFSSPMRCNRLLPLGLCVCVWLFSTIYILFFSADSVVLPSITASSFLAIAIFLVIFQAETTILTTKTTKMSIHPNRTLASYNFHCENCIKWSPANFNILTNTYTLMKEKRS